MCGCVCVHACVNACTRKCMCACVCELVTHSAPFHRWPLIIDTSGQASTFLRYRDTNYITAIRPSDMEPERARMAILGAIRFGKPLVLDMMEVDMFQTAGDCFDRIMPGLLASIMDKSILKNEKYAFDVLILPMIGLACLTTDLIADFV